MELPLFWLKKAQSVLTASIKRKQKYLRNLVCHQSQKLTLLQALPTSKTQKL